MKPLNTCMHISSPFQGHDCIFIIIFFKIKETSNSKVKNLYLERQIDIYTVAQKTWTNYFILNYFFNAKCNLGRR